MTLNDLETLVERLSEILNDTKQCAASLRQLSFSQWSCCGQTADWKFLNPHSSTRNSLRACTPHAIHSGRLSAKRTADEWDCDSDDASFL